MELLRHGHMPSFAAMLAYVFWHWPRPNMNAAQYEAAQRAFHAALDAAPPAGFSASHSAALRGVPWAAGGGPAYEDWYLVQASASLDPLNQAAITGSRQQPHDAAAALAAGGAAGLYLLRAGEPVIPPARAICSCASRNGRRPRACGSGATSRPRWRSARAQPCR